MEPSHKRLALAFLAFAAGCGARQAADPAAAPAAAPSPYYTNTCPVPPGIEGYAVVARASDSTFADTAYLRRVAQRVVGAWEPPQSTSLAPPLGQVRERQRELPRDLELWGLWAPGAGDTATLMVTVLRDGSVTAPRLVTRAVNPAFTKSLARISNRLKQRCRGRNCPGPLPPGTAGDTLAVVLHFGARPREGEPSVRWAAQGHPVLPPPDRSTPKYPERLRSEEITGDVVVGFDVDTTGRTVRGSVEVLYATHPLFAGAVLDWVREVRFRPAVSNCRKVPWSEEQRVRFSLQ